MQYLIKLTLSRLPLWRLLALDGGDRIDFCVTLTSLAFEYPDGAWELIRKNDRLTSAASGDLARTLDSLSLKDGEIFTLTLTLTEGVTLEHEARVLKIAPRLDCLVPGCLMGSGAVPPSPVTLERIRQTLDLEEPPAPNIRMLTRRMRSLALGAAGANDSGDGISFRPV